MTPKLSTEKKLAIRELQLQESLMRGALNDAKHKHEIAGAALAQSFNSLSVEGFTLSPDTLEYVEKESKSELIPIPRPA